MPRALPATALLCAALGCRRDAPPEAGAPPAAPPAHREAAIPTGQEPSAPSPGASVEAVPAAALEEIRRSLQPLVARFAFGYARSSRLATGALSGGATRSLAFPVQAGYCYRVFAAATRAAGDMDLTLYNEGSEAIEADGSYGTTAFLGLRQPLCFNAAGVHRLDVMMMEGPGGSYGVEVFRVAEAQSDVGLGYRHYYRH